MTTLDDWRDHIERALVYSGGTHIFEDIRDAVATGRMQLWENAQSMAITEIIVYPRKKVLNIFLASGTMQGVQDMLASAEYWGRMQGCDSVTFAGRRGWRKVMNKQGFKDTLTVMEKEL